MFHHALSLYLSSQNISYPELSGSLQCTYIRSQFKYSHLSLLEYWSLCDCSLRVECDPLNANLLSNQREENEEWIFSTSGDVPTAYNTNQISHFSGKQALICILISIHPCKEKNSLDYQNTKFVWQILSTTLQLLKWKLCHNSNVFNHSLT